MAFAGDRIEAEIDTAGAVLLYSADSNSRSAAPALPGLDAVFVMSDHTGLRYSGPGAAPHGAAYRLDDNARALMLMNQHPGVAEEERTVWSSIYGAFVQAAWSEEQGRFRTVQTGDGCWRDEADPDHANGRTLWALGHTFENAPDPAMQQWALGWFERAGSRLAGLAEPRARAFVALGASAVLRMSPDHEPARTMAAREGDFLLALIGEGRRPDWSWFEAVLGCDSPRVSQAMIETGEVLGDRRLVQEGLETLGWIAEQMSADALAADQPLTMQAVIEAALSAYRASGGEAWRNQIDRACRALAGRGARCGEELDEILAHQFSVCATRGLNGMGAGRLRLPPSATRSASSDSAMA